MHYSNRIHTANGILAALPPGEIALIRERVEKIEIASETAIHKPGATVKHIYFPLSGVISTLQIMENGACGEIAVIGNEGIEGIVPFMGGHTSSSWTIAQSELTALRIPTTSAKRIFARGGAFQHLVLRFLQALMMQMGQTVVCNLHHPLEKRLCRWLLLNFDRTPSGQLAITQETISNMLGVRREGITGAARHLQALGVIKYSRGRITLLDRDGLAGHSCECYQVIQREYERLLYPPAK